MGRRTLGRVRTSTGLAVAQQACHPARSAQAARGPPGWGRRPGSLGSVDEHVRNDPLPVESCRIMGYTNGDESRRAKLNRCAPTRSGFQVMFDMMGPRVILWWAIVLSQLLASASFAVDIIPNQDPVALIHDSDSDPWERWTLAAPASLFLDGWESYDPDDDELTYLWTVENSERTATAAGAFVTIELKDVGFYEVTLTVSDPSGGTDSTWLPSPVEVLPEDACVRQPSPDASFPDYEAALEQWKATACENPGMFDAVGLCDGLRFIKSAGGYTGTISYYDAQTGEYVGGASWTDVASGPCGGRTYHVQKVECENGTAISLDLLCGGSSAWGGQSGATCGAVGASSAAGSLLLAVLCVGGPVRRRYPRQGLVTMSVSVSSGSLPARQHSCSKIARRR